MNKNQPFRKYRPGCEGEVYHFAGKTPMFHPPGFITPMMIIRNKPESIIEKTEMNRNQPQLIIYHNQKKYPQ